jgi:hypothetical protein
MAAKEQHSRIKIIFLLAAVVLLVLCSMSYIRIKNLIDDSELVDHTQAVKLELDKTFFILNQVESSQRGYLLTKDSVFLLPFFAANTNLNLQLATIASLTKDNPIQEQNTSELRVVVFKRLDYLNKILNDAETSTITTQRWLRGKALMDDVSKQITKMLNEENKLLKVRSTALNKSTTATPLLILSLIIGSIIILAAAYIKVIQELKTSDKLKFNL